MSISLMYRIREKVTRKLCVTRLFESKTGIKIINAIMKNEDLSHSEVFFIEASELFLGFDALNDTYTLCGTCILDSPHFGLMRLLNDGSDIDKSDYCLRSAKGALDGRYPIIVNNGEIERLKRCFLERKGEIDSAESKPVQVYRIDGKYYLADGKHRASLSVLMGNKVKCIEIRDDFLKDSCRLWIYRKMKEKPQKYSKNIALFERCLNCSSGN